MRNLESVLQHTCNLYHKSANRVFVALGARGREFTLPSSARFNILSFIVVEEEVSESFWRSLAVSEELFMPQLGIVA